MLEKTKELMHHQMYEAIVFGKEGCTKCDALKGKLNRFIDKNNLDVKITYHDVLTLDGLTKAIIDPDVDPKNNIPGLVIKDDKNNEVYRRMTDYSTPQGSIFTEEHYGPFLSKAKKQNYDSSCKDNTCIL